jgi:signal transduction histidine kinase
MALFVTASATLLRLSLDSLDPGIVPFALFYPAVLISAVCCGAGPGVVTLVGSGIIVTYFWLPPKGSLLFTHTSILNLGLFAVTAGSIIIVGHILRLSLQRSAITTLALSRNSDQLEDLARELEARVASTVAEREMALQQLHETRKAETIGQLTGGIAHDFNNLLTPIIGTLDLLNSRDVPAARSQRLIAGALAAAEKASTLVNRMLAFGRRQLLQPRAVNITSLLNDLSDLLQRSIGPTIRLVMDLPRDLPAIRVDPNQLELALLSLAVNARDAMPNGGTLTISVQADVSSEDPASIDQIRISVVDTGTGMDEATLQRATEPFFTTKKTGRGTGLGLSMVHGLAAQSGGRLVLSSMPGVGTRAELWFPPTDEQIAEPQPAEEWQNSVSQNLRILLVDDEPLVRAGLAEMLREAGHEIVEVESAREALSLVDDCAAFDLILTDHLMPGMTGGALALKLRDSHPYLPIVLITGYAGSEADVPDGINKLRKPIRQTELLGAIDAAFEATSNVIRLPASN